MLEPSVGISLCAKAPDGTSNVRMIRGMRNLYMSYT